MRPILGDWGNITKQSSICLPMFLQITLLHAAYSVYCCLTGLITLWAGRNSSTVSLSGQLECVVSLANGPSYEKSRKINRLVTFKNSQVMLSKLTNRLHINTLKMLEVDTVGLLSKIQNRLLSYNFLITNFSWAPRGRTSGFIKPPGTSVSTLLALGAQVTKTDTPWIQAHGEIQHTSAF